MGDRHPALSEQLGAAGWATGRCDDTAECRPWHRDHPLGNACGMGYRHSALSEQLGAVGWAADRCDDVAALSIPVALNRPTMQ